MHLSAAGNTLHPRELATKGQMLHSGKVDHPLQNPRLSAERETRPGVDGGRLGWIEQWVNSRLLVVSRASG